VGGLTIICCLHGIRSFGEGLECGQYVIVCGLLGHGILCRYLEPKLCVQMAGGVLDPGSVQRLPTVGVYAAANSVAACLKPVTCATAAWQQWNTELQGPLLVMMSSIA
jgi:hypothetical protein